MKRIYSLLLCAAATLISHGVNAAAENDYPQRIIALSPHSVELLYAIGAGDKIVATTSHSDYPAQAKNIEVIGDHRGITLEKLIALNPDLVVTWGSGNKINQIEQIKKLGFRVIDSDPQSFAQIAQTLRQLGEVTGHAQQAERIALKFEKDLAVIIKDYQYKSKVKVFYQMWSKPMMTISKDSWVNQFIDQCGGENVFANAATAYPTVSIENVLLSKAEVILVPKSSTARNHELFDWQHWTLLPAVKNKHIYYPDAKIIHRPTPRVLSPLLAVCRFIDKAR
ncbi:MAG: cobalamin-binding protein [Psychrobium sp.]|nr:cobalamin-binding protein [Psychrobium sp.]